MDSVVIVGANIAGTRAAETLRQNGFAGAIKMIGAEAHLPYERPMLSKELLWDRTRLPTSFFLHDERWFAEQNIELHLGRNAVKLDLPGQAVVLEGGLAVTGDQILLATGGRPRLLLLDGAGAPNVHYLRDKDGADRLAAQLLPGVRLAVIGMGVIGAEVAASARKLGCDVIAIEPAATPMARTLGGVLGEWLARQHAAGGVETHYNRRPSRLITDQGLVKIVELDDGTRIDCDVVLVGVGIEPAVELARDAGLAIGNGIAVDGDCRTSNEAVFAAGDVAEQPGFFGSRTRLETYQNAADQGAAAAAAMLDLPGGDARPCWFWTDQYDFNLQVAGEIVDHFELVVRGDPDENSYVHFYLDKGMVKGVATVNRPQDMAVGKRLVERRAGVDAAVLRDQDQPLRALLKAPR